MSNKKSWSLKAAVGITAIYLSMIMGVATTSLAADYDEIRIYPEHVGMFTTVGKQQFLAFGYVNDGNNVSLTNITKDVNWVSSDEAIVTIDNNGVAELVSGKTYGQVKITCSYPKIGGPETVGVGRATNLLLLKKQ